MAIFIARVVTNEGIKVIKVDAIDKSEAERKAQQKAGHVLSVKRRFDFDVSRGMNASERNTFMLRLSSMVGSKMPVTKALDLLATTFSGRIKTCAQGLMAQLEAGCTLAEAIDRDRKNFPIATAALVKAGVQGGETWKALRDAAEFEYLISGIQKGAMKDIAAAIGTFIVSAALMLSSVYYFGPQVTENPMFKQSDAVNVGWIEVTGKVLCGIQIVMLVIFAMFLWLGTAGRALMPDLADKLILKIPYYKDLVLSRNAYVVLYKFGLLVGSGIPMEESLALTAEGSPRGALRSDIERALVFIRSGKTWANALETLHPTDRAALSSSTDREDTARTLDMLARQYRDMYMSRIKSFAPALQMVAALFMTAAGALLFGLVILPMLQFSAGI